MYYLLDLKVSEFFIHFFLCSSFSFLTFSFYELVHFFLNLVSRWMGIKAAAPIILTILVFNILSRMVHLFSIMTFELLEIVVMMQGVWGGKLVGKKYWIYL